MQAETGNPVAMAGVKRAMQTHLEAVFQTAAQAVCREDMLRFIAISSGEAGPAGRIDPASPGCRQGALG
jgi:hypothetical protein